MQTQDVRHENLKMVMQELKKSFKDAPDELYDKLRWEISYSTLIIAGDVKGNYINTATTDIGGMKLFLLFTDMDEYRKVFPDFSVEAHSNPFLTYFNLLKESDCHGFVINLDSEYFVIPKDAMDDDEYFPEFEFSDEDSYTSGELKEFKNQINNTELEEFIQNPQNTAKYEELFEMISKSGLITLMLSAEDLSVHAEDGVISTEEIETPVYCYVERMGGKYATVYTSESMTDSIPVKRNKYSQLVNFCQMTNCVLFDDLDGIIINPKNDNIVLTRDTLLEFSPVIGMKCNNHKLNSAVNHVFLMEE